VKLQGTEYADLEVTEKLGEGKRSVVYRARWRGREIGLKVYKPAAIANHARKHKLPLAEFEHRRNKAFFEARGMAKYVAEPLGFVVEPGFQMSLQECPRRRGVLLRAARPRGVHFAAIHEDLNKLVSLSHEAEAVRHRPARNDTSWSIARRAAQAVRFQSNPVHRATSEPFSSGLALKLGLLGRESRDLRKLKNFTNYDRVERKLLRFYKKSTSTRA
jgi:hypothetical protein